MAQAQLNFAENIFAEHLGFDKVTWSPVNKLITCTLCDDYTLLLKRKRHQIKVYLKKGSKQINVPLPVFETVCDLKESLLLLASFLAGQSSC